MPLVPYRGELQLCRRALLDWEERLRTLADRARASAGTAFLVAAVRSLRERMEVELSGEIGVPAQYRTCLREALVRAERQLARISDESTRDECLEVLADALVAVTAQGRYLDSLAADG